MGTDIRLYPERYVDGRWQFIGEMEENSFYVYDPEHEPPSCPKDLYDIRNYGLFAILADVRNDEGYECIVQRRGIPGDLSPEVKSYFAYYTKSYREDKSDTLALARDEKQRASWIAYDIDMQLSPGWLTLEELANFPWHEKHIQIYAIVDKRVAHLFHPERGFPFREWPADIQCSYSTTQKENPYCNASWTQTYAEAAGADFMKLLSTYVQQYGASKDVRFVFWFSS
jgi:hypothetical protein